MANNKTKNPPADGASRSEFEEFKREMGESINVILDAIAKIGASGKVQEAGVPVAKEENGGPQESLPPQYRKIFEKYFDSADGFDAQLTFPGFDEKGNETGGITFTIVVPEKHSNMNEGQKKANKRGFSDLRTRALQPAKIAKGIDEWCAAVAKNLKYNKLVKTK